jgi:hypothetical protein
MLILRFGLVLRSAFVVLKSSSRLHHTSFGPWFGILLGPVSGLLMVPPQPLVILLVTSHVGHTRGFHVLKLKALTRGCWNTRSRVRVRVPAFGRTFPKYSLNVL